MTENPYAAPESSADPEPPPLSPLPALPGRRPIGITILSILHLVGGVGLFVVFVFTASVSLLTSRFDNLAQPLEQMGMPVPLLVAGMLFLCVLSVWSAIGMWRGTPWGWWLGSFYYIYAVFRNASALVTVLMMAEELEGSTRGPGYYIFKHTGRIVVHLLLFCYFFRGNVLAYFGLSHINKGKAIWKLIGVCLAIGSFASVWSFLAML